MDRRKFIQLAGGAVIASPLSALAQQAAGLPLVAVLLPSTEDRAVKMVAALRDGLKQAGLIEGTHYALAARFANGDMPQLPTLAKELDALGPRLFVTGANATLVVRQQAPNTPLVFTGVAADVIALGWAESYARPGGMMTGNVQNAAGGEEAITAKRIGLFKELTSAHSIFRVALSSSATFLRLWHLLQRPADQSAASTPSSHAPDV